MSESNKFNYAGTKMIKPGLVSVTFRPLSTDNIIKLCAENNLNAIEWGGDIHVPHGDLKRAQAVGNTTRNAGLTTCAYGSYYQVAESLNKQLSFQCVLDTAKALGAPMIRVWAGSKNSEDADDAYWKAVIDESHQMSELALKEKIEIAFEFHSNSLTNTAQSAQKLVSQIARKNTGLYWQPIHGLTVDQNCEGLKQIMPWLRSVHVFHWWPDYTQRFLLSEGIEKWISFFSLIKSDGKNRFALLEFVKDDSIENFIKDVQTLKTLLE